MLHDRPTSQGEDQISASTVFLRWWWRREVGGGTVITPPPLIDLGRDVCFSMNKLISIELQSTVHRCLFLKKEPLNFSWKSCTFHSLKQRLMIYINLKLLIANEPWTTLLKTIGSLPSPMWISEWDSSKNVHLVFKR